MESRQLIIRLLAYYTIFVAQSSLADSVHKPKGEWYLKFNNNTSAINPRNLDEFNKSSAADINLPNNKFSASFGYAAHSKHKGSMRLEAEFLSDKNGDKNESSTMVNAFYDMGGKYLVVPYAGAGVGMTNLHNTWYESYGARINENSTVPSYQVVAGFSSGSAFGSNAVVDVMCKYFETISNVDLDMNMPGKYKITTKSVKADIKLKF